LVLEHLAFGTDFLNRSQATAMSNALGVTPVRRIGALGDSITGFYDGYHARLNQLLGQGRVIVANFGLSGDTTQMILNRLDDSMYGRQFKDAMVMAGINDILFFDQTAQTVKDNLSLIYKKLACNGMEVTAITLLPAKNNTFNSWTPAKQLL